MSEQEPYFREVGSGPSIVCMHANAGTSGQWRALMDLAAPKFRIFAVDSYGAGKSPEWPSDRVIRLEDEAALLEPVLARAGTPVALVGHSYGGAIALIAALAHPARVRALVLYEPTLFSLIESAQPAPNAADGIRQTLVDVETALERGDLDAAAARFLDYWMGSGTWAGMPEQRKPPIAAAMAKARRWGHALFKEPAPLEAFRALDMPVLYLVGKRSTAAAHGVATLLATVLPKAEFVEFEKLGHMGPVTHAERVNEVILPFLERTA